MADKYVNALGRYREENGLTWEQVAEQISTATDKPVQAHGVKMRGGKGKVPPLWAEALNLTEQDEEPHQDEPAPPSLGPTVRDEGDPPQAPEGAPRRPSPGPATSGDYSVVRERIGKAYAAIGAGAAMVTHNNGYAAVADLYKDDIANAWVSAARENKNVAKIVSFMESGGPVGELVVAHVILVLGFVYVSGRAPALSVLYGNNLGQFHEAAARAVWEAEQAADAVGGNGAVDPLAYAPG